MIRQRKPLSHLSLAGLRQRIANTAGQALYLRQNAYRIGLSAAECQQRLAAYDAANVEARQELSRRTARRISPEWLDASEGPSGLTSCIAQLKAAGSDEGGSQ